MVNQIGSEDHNASEWSRIKLASHEIDIIFIYREQQSLEK